MAQQTVIVRTDEPYPHPRARSGLWDILRRRPDAAAHLFIIAVALVLAWHTWARWGGVQVDCGKALYVPVEILRGKLLYRDLWYPYGPLTPYLLAGLIGLFGQHLNVLYCFGIALAIGCAMLLYRIGTALDARAAGLVAAFALVIRAFGFFGHSQFSYPFPYSYAATLGLFLSLLCSWLTVEYLLERASRKLMLAGVMAGLALLCKPEIGAASWFILAVAICVSALVERRWRGLLQGTAYCLPGLLLSLIVYGWFCWRLGFVFVFQQNLVAMPGSYFSRMYGARWAASIGLRFVPAEMTCLIISAAMVLPTWFLIGKGACVGRKRIGGGFFLGWLFVLVVGTALARYRADSGNPDYAILLAFPPGMYFIACGFLVYLVYEVFRQNDRRSLAEAVFTLFALTLAIPVMVEPQVNFLAVFYVPPLTLVFMLVLARCFRAASKGMSKTRRREFVNVFLAVEAVLLAIIFVPGANLRNAPFRTSWGTIYLTREKAAVLRHMLDFISEQKRLGRKVIVLPELTGFYAFTGTEAPSRWYMVVPGYPRPKGEIGYIEALKRAAPSYIIISNEYSGSYGAPYFGLDYDRKIYRWLQRNYRVTGQFGGFRREEKAPLAALIYERKSAARLRR